MSKLFGFGERVEGYAVPVLNEREVRASAGILFLFAFISFMSAWQVGNFRLTRIFVIAFLIDFAIRLFVNPRFSPSLILGRFVVRNQIPEYVGAPQKRFAWAIGFALALAMLFLIVIKNIVGPINLLVCATCLLLMFFESAFGICIGCKIYNRFNKEPAQLCPGGSCEVSSRQPIQYIGIPQVMIVIAFLALIGLVSQLISTPTEAPAHITPATTGGADCTPPDWAVAMGHADKWKLHHNCK